VDRAFRAAIEELSSNVNVSDLIFGYHSFLTKELQLPIDSFLCILAKLSFPIKQLDELKGLLNY